MLQLKLKPLDAAFPTQRQLREEMGPVILVNLFTLGAADEAAFLAPWAKDAACMRARPGFFSAQLHRAVGDRPTYFNYAL